MLSVARTALAILERPPCNDFIFDNFGCKSLGMGEYPINKVNIADIVDLGERFHEQNPPIFH